MLDPLPPPPLWLQRWATPLAEYLALPTLPYHIHEVLFFFVLYQFVHSVVSPKLSARFFPKYYPNFSKRTKLSWDVHTVSLLQSTLISATGLWVIFCDEERKTMTAGERVYGYTGACGLIQAMATGYFLWDLIISTRHIKVFGVGMWFHGASALWVFSFGFRPFVNYYGPTFILYELSSPFLNFHWFFDKVNMTGSKPQWYNGMVLLSVFFCCRLVWGSWQSVHIFADIFKAVRQSHPSTTITEPFDIHSMVFGSRNPTICTDEYCIKASAEVSEFASYTAGGIPIWLVITYLGSNLILNSLNFYWFSKMIDTVMKRFRAPVTTDEGKTDHAAKSMEKEANDIVLEAAATLEEEERVLINGGTKGGSDDNEPAITIQTNGNKRSSARRRKA